MFSLLLFVPTLRNPHAETNLFKKIKVVRRVEPRLLFDKSVQTDSDEVAVVGNDSRGGDGGNGVVEGEYETELFSVELEYFMKIEIQRAASFTQRCKPCGLHNPHELEAFSFLTYPVVLDNHSISLFHFRHSIRPPTS